ncbi:MAG: MoxR family ATPase [Epsilonproteobacteria bacterium]|nr:MoxR family ATPase [Campylobacterota bacterium]
MSEKLVQIKQEVQKVIVGQEAMIDSLLIGLLCEGHILLEGVPGLAKTTTVNTLAKTLGLEFKRVQFTPDLLPSDIIGTEIYDPKNNEFRVKHGPIFTNLLLADEINRAPAKVQSALLEAMQERQVTIADETFKIQRPFLTLATQNPIEQEGAYSLPEAQLDRFMLKIVVGYNTKEEELEIVTRIAEGKLDEVHNVASQEDLEVLKEEVKSIHIDEELKKYIVNLIFATREPENYGLSKYKEYIQYGASPRASINLFNASKAYAYLRGKDHVTPVDIAAMSKDVLRHRVIMSYEAEAEGVSSDQIIEKVLEAVDIP